jgi:hypothetical protein
MIRTPSPRKGALIRCYAVRPLGLEPRTNGLKVHCSTIELEARGRQSLWETMSSLWSVGKRAKPNGSLVDLDSPSFGVWLPTIAHVSADERLLSAFRRLCCVVG